MALIHSPAMSHDIVISGWTVLVGKSGHQTVDKAGWEIVVELSYVQSDLKR